MPRGYPNKKESASHEEFKNELQKAGQKFKKACQHQIFQPPACRPMEIAMLLERPFEKYWYQSMPAIHRRTVMRLIEKGLLIDSEPPVLSPAGHHYVGMLELTGVKAE